MGIENFKTTCLTPSSESAYEDAPDFAIKLDKKLLDVLISKIQFAMPCICENDGQKLIAGKMSVKSMDLDCVMLEVGILSGIIKNVDGSDLDISGTIIGIRINLRNISEIVGSYSNPNYQLKVEIENNELVDSVVLYFIPGKVREKIEENLLRVILQDKIVTYWKNKEYSFSISLPDMQPRYLPGKIVLSHFSSGVYLNIRTLDDCSKPINHELDPKGHSVAINLNYIWRTIVNPLICKEYNGDSSKITSTYNYWSYFANGGKRLWYSDNEVNIDGDKLEIKFNGNTVDIYSNFYVYIKKENKKLEMTVNIKLIFPTININALTGNYNTYFQIRFPFDYDIPYVKIHTSWVKGGENIVKETIKSKLDPITRNVYPIKSIDLIQPLNIKLFSLDWASTIDFEWIEW